MLFSGVRVGDTCSKTSWTRNWDIPCSKYVIQYFWMLKKKITWKHRIKRGKSAWKEEIDLKGSPCITVTASKSSKLITMLKGSNLCQKVEILCFWQNQNLFFQNFKILLPKGQLAGSEIMVKCFSKGNKKKEKTENFCKRPKNKTPFRVSNNRLNPSWTSDIKKEPNTHKEEQERKQEEGEEYDISYEDESEFASDIFYED